MKIPRIQGPFKFLSRSPLHDPMAIHPAATEVRTTCYMCACRCGIRVHLRDGEARYVDGNPAHPLNQAVICAKGSSGIMKQNSPARRTQALLRKEGANRGAGEFVPISWERAFEILAARVSKIRATDPKKFALFTGRDQMQALTGLFARQFGTPNYAAHCGLCSVNMAAGMIYSIGGSCWEFGGPDLERANLFVMLGTAEAGAASSSSIRCAPAIRPSRMNGYPSARARTRAFDALLHELIATGLIDRSFLQRYTNAPQLVVLDAGEREGLFAFDPAAGAVAH